MDIAATFMLVAFLGACFAAATTGALFKPGDWYDRLTKPVWNPPNWLFPIAWAALYMMMAFAAWLVWRAEGFGWALAAWGLQLVLNAIWSVLFFGIRRLGVALAEAVALWFAILACVLLFAPVSTLAAALMLPYLAWVSFAVVLNLTMWRLNPGPHPWITMAEIKQPPGRARRRMAQP